MKELPLDPSECPWTSEGKEIYEQQRSRALQRRLEAAENAQDRYYCRHA